MPDKGVVLRYAAARRLVGLPWMWEAHSYLEVCNNRLRDAEKMLKLRCLSPPPRAEYVPDLEVSDAEEDRPSFPPCCASGCCAGAPDTPH